MLTVLEALNASVSYLEKKNIKSARLNAELLLAHILKCRRMELYLSFDRPLKENEIEQYREALKRRSSFEPLQYIVGKVEFYGIELEINSSVLIPRPETELLVEEVINLYSKELSLKILDIGSGSGNISIALAKHFPNSKITGIEVSEAALELSKRNAEKNIVQDQINFVRQDVLEDFKNSSNGFDVIVSNPPYISAEDFNTLESELRLYEPKYALTDEKDGLTFFKKISSIARGILNRNGKVIFEIGYGQSNDVKRILLENGFSKVTVKKDYSNIDRIIIGEIN